MNFIRRKLHYYFRHGRAKVRTIIIVLFGPLLVVVTMFFNINPPFTDKDYWELVKDEWNNLD